MTAWPRHGSHRIVPPRRRTGVEDPARARPPRGRPDPAASGTRSRVLAAARHRQRRRHRARRRPVAQRPLRRLGGRVRPRRVPRRQRASPDAGGAPRRAGTCGSARSAATAPGREFDPLAGLDEGSGDGPVAIITRANVRRRSWKAFGAASEVVDAELHRAPGLIDVVGIGETPVGALATFSLWDVARRRPCVRVLDARPCRGDAANPRRGLVRRGDVRPLRALRVHRHLERQRSARRHHSAIAVVTIEAHR